LPNGSFPGSACGASDFCADNLGGEEAVDQRCEDGTCVVECPADTEAICDGLTPGTTAVLTCSESAGNICVPACVAGLCPTGFSCLDPTGENACLPTGSFPGSPCRTSGTACDADLGGNSAVDMICVDDTCVVDCDAGDEAAGDALCGAVDSSLTCSESASDICVLECAVGDCPTGFSCLDPGGENACLPDGSFPGSACRATAGDECDHDLLGNAAFDMECTAVDLCSIVCDDSGTGDTLCGSFDPRLTCSTLAGDFCVFACGTGDTCPPGFTCVPSEDSCLPTP
jgi:hypothetical protein